ncbi:MAG: 50S ribosomal protein L11 methyltransferase [Deltaproteobacteria bacterium]|nr:50S ribosomal protein L11 methyltransferase [Deltaproteobacteria bacterium]
MPLRNYVVSNLTPYPCLHVTAPLERADEISWLLVDFGAQAVEQRDETTMKASGAELCMLLAGFSGPTDRDLARAALHSHLDEKTEVRSVDVTDDGWSTRWREFHQPVILEKLQIIAPWMDPPTKDRIAIVIDPGQAFGTGGHDTTHLILEMLEGRSELPREVLDVGTGSGVLAIAAVKLGAKKVTAIDIDEDAFAATRENAQANQVADHIDTLLGTARDLDETWSLVLANLELGVFLKSAGSIAKRVAPGGKVLLSGLLIGQVEQCLSLWPGFELVARREKDGWAALALRRIP